MDVRQYFRKLREIEAGIAEPFTFITSLENPDGGRPGVISEVSRELAAKLLAEGRAVLSSDGEVKEFQETQVAKKMAFEKAEMAKRVQVTIVSDSETGVVTASKVSGSTTTRK